MPRLTLTDMETIAIRMALLRARLAAITAAGLAWSQS